VFSPLAREPLKRLASFVGIFGPDQNLSVVTVRIASVPAVSVWINVPWIRLDDGFDPGLVQNALGRLSICS
jgi:hypothetical protein